MSAQAEVRPNDWELFRETQKLSAPSNLHYWCVHSEFQDGGINKMGSSSSKYWLYVESAVSLYIL